MNNFLDLPEQRIIYRGTYFFVVKDGFPVTKGHSLIISNVLRKTYFDLTEEEMIALPNEIKRLRL